MPSQGSTMTAYPTLPPLVEAYLADLDRALAGADPRERAETLAAVRDHATDALAVKDGESQAQAVMRVLTQLGPVDSIAASATPAPPPSLAGLAGSAPREDGPLLGVSILSLFVPILPIATLVWAIVRLRAHTGNRGRQLAARTVSIVALVLQLIVVFGLVASWATLSRSSELPPAVISTVESGNG